MKPLLIIAFLFILCPVASFSQNKVECPISMICLTQEAANRAFENAKLIPALEEKITVQENALAQKDKSIKELQDVAKKNEADLTQAIHSTEVKLATATGQLIEMQADRIRWMSVIDVLIKNSRQKTNGIKIF